MQANILLIILGAAILILNIFLAWFLISGKRREDVERSLNKESERGGFNFLQNQLNELSRVIDSKIGETTRTVSDSVRYQYGESQKLMQAINKQVTDQLLEVKKSMAESTEASKNVFSIAEQLRNFEKILKHQKQRGALGEASLGLILDNILPPTAYKLQYHFSDGDIVDAVIMTKEGMISVDAKFSLDNYNRLVEERDDARRIELERSFKNDLKRRIDETAKYIKPKYGTLPFAFMFIPAEGIYYDLLVNEIGAVKINARSLIDYAYRDKNVIVVSPTTFAAYLQSVLYGFRAFQIEKQAKDIIKNVEQLSRHLARYDDYLKRMGHSLSTTVNHYNAADKEFGKIDKDVLKITGETAGTEQLMVEKPGRD